MRSMLLPKTEPRLPDDPVFANAVYEHGEWGWTNEADEHSPFTYVGLYWDRALRLWQLGCSAEQATWEQIEWAADIMYRVRRAIEAAGQAHGWGDE